MQENIFISQPAEGAVINDWRHVSFVLSMHRGEVEHMRTTHIREQYASMEILGNETIKGKKTKHMVLFALPVIKEAQNNNS